MIKLIRQIRQHHNNFDVHWNEVGRETQEHIVKTAPELLHRLGVWYNEQNVLIAELENKIEEMSTDKLIDDTVKETDGDV